MRQYSHQRTMELAKEIYLGAISKKNIGYQAFQFNFFAHEDAVYELAQVNGFIELVKTALPPEQRGMGWVANFNIVTKYRD